MDERPWPKIWFEFHRLAALVAELFDSLDRPHRLIAELKDRVDRLEQDD
jgi:hypothetical protein